MSLTKSKVSDIPEGSVLLTEQQALKYQSALIQKWENASDVFAARYGIYFLGGLASLSGVFINSYFRRKFRLGPYGSIATYFPLFAMPASSAMLLHAELVLPNIMLMKQETCPICLELRAAALQSFIGVVFPLVIAPLGCLSVAQRYATINLPYITEKPKVVFQILKKMFVPFGTTAWYLFLGQAFVGCAVTYFESRSISLINMKLALMEEKEHYSFD